MFFFLNYYWSARFAGPAAMFQSTTKLVLAGFSSRHMVKEQRGAVLLSFPLGPSRLALYRGWGWNHWFQNSLKNTARAPLDESRGDTQSCSHTHTHHAFSDCAAEGRGQSHLHAKPLWMSQRRRRKREPSTLCPRSLMSKSMNLSHWRKRERGALTGPRGPGQNALSYACTAAHE